MNRTVPFAVAAFATALLTAPAALAAQATSSSTPSRSAAVANERISRAALDRVEKLDAAIDGRVARKAVRLTVPRSVTAAWVRMERARVLNVGWRVHRLEARLDGRADPPKPVAPEHVTATNTQLALTQKLAQRALKEAAVLDSRVPPLPVPRPDIQSASLIRIRATATGARTMRLVEVVGGPAPVVGTEVVLINAPGFRVLTRNSPVIGAGWFSGKVFFPSSEVSVEPAN